MPTKRRERQCYESLKSKVGQIRSDQIRAALSGDPTVVTLGSEREGTLGSEREGTLGSEREGKDERKRALTLILTLTLTLTLALILPLDPSPPLGKVGNAQEVADDGQMRIDTLMVMVEAKAELGAINVLSAEMRALEVCTAPVPVPVLYLVGTRTPHHTTPCP